MAKDKQERYVLIEDNQIIAELFGKLDENIEIIEKELNVEILLEEGKITVIGEELSAELGERLIQKLIEIIKTQKKLTKQYRNNLEFNLALILILW